MNTKKYMISLKENLFLYPSLKNRLKEYVKYICFKDVKLLTFLFTIYCGERGTLFGTSFKLFEASLVAQLVKNLPAMRETWVGSLGWEDPLEKGKSTHPSILAWKIPWTVQSMGPQRVRHD